MNKPISDAIEELTKRKYPPMPFQEESDKSWNLATEKAIEDLKALDAQVIGFDELYAILKDAYLDVANNYSVSDLHHDPDKVSCVAAKMRQTVLDKLTEYRKASEPGGPEETEYNFSMKVTGYYRASVRAKSYEEAEAEANHETQEADFGVLEDIEWEVSDIS